jgi:hypothetical protein
MPYDDSGYIPIGPEKTDNIIKPKKPEPSSIRTIKEGSHISEEKKIDLDKEFKKQITQNLLKFVRAENKKLDGKMWISPEEHENIVSTYERIINDGTSFDN